MDDHSKTPPKPKGDKNSHYANLRREHRARKIERGEYEVPDAMPEGRTFIYGIHAVKAAIENAGRKKYRLLITDNAANRMALGDLNALGFPVETTHPRNIDKLVGTDAVHQGALLESDILATKTIEDIIDCQLVIVLDQVTDPHNVGALIRSGVAMNASALLTTARHSPSESGVLAKAASGALEHLPLVHVRNLSNAIEELNKRGFQSIGLDSQGPAPLEETISGKKIALVLGAEGKGLRQKTRDTVTDLARLDMPGPIKSLNVSNAAVLALYVAHRHLNI